ncbi:MAG: hypothetical protein HND45_11820 [Chloroflexi bacterium]|nr:hypothetical protein [Chloroflexota bacterium]NOG76565.1 hypothetical protein [Chloroflexota bacterium]
MNEHLNYNRSVDISKVNDHLYTVFCQGHGFRRDQAALSANGSLSLGMFANYEDAAEAAALYMRTGDATLPTGKEIQVR